MFVLVHEKKQKKKTSHRGNKQEGLFQFIFKLLQITASFVVVSVCPPATPHHHRFPAVITEASAHFLHVAHRQGGETGGNRLKLHDTIKFLCLCNLLRARNKARDAETLFSAEAAGARSIKSVALVPPFRESPTSR